VGENLSESEQERWRAAMNAFRKFPIAHPAGWRRWDGSVVTQRIDPDLSEQQTAEVREAFETECGGNRRLQAIGQTIARRTDPITSAEQIVQEVGEVAAPLYARIWAGCSNAERLALCYIARDGFLNAKAGTEIRELCRKGLLLRKPGYRLINESFRQYVLDVRDAGLMERLGGKRYSRWDVFPDILQALVYGLGAIVVVTLAVSQKETLQSFAGYFTAFIGALGTAGKLLSARGGAGAPPSA
jgi:hypothetical protein